MKMQSSCLAAALIALGAAACSKEVPPAPAAKVEAPKATDPVPAPSNPTADDRPKSDATAIGGLPPADTKDAAKK
jgi:hypothetical protein